MSQLSELINVILSCVLLVNIIGEQVLTVKLDLSSANEENSTTVRTTTITTTTQRKEENGYVLLEKWHCGATSFDKSLSHQMVEQSCITRMYEANLCCLAHDLCYMEIDKTQNYCDSAFCFCLNHTLTETARSMNKSVLGCKEVASTFCTVVQIFGAAAHHGSSALLTTTKTLSTTTVAKIEQTTKSTSDTNTTITPQTPAEIAQFVMHNVSFECFNHQLITCVEELHECVLIYEKESKAFFNDKKMVTLSQHTQVAIRAKAVANAAALCSFQFCDCVLKRPTPGNTTYKSIFVNLTFIDVNTKKKMEAKCDANIELMCPDFRTAKETRFHLLHNNDINPISRLNLNFWSVNVEYLGYLFNLTTVAFFGGFFALLAFASIMYVGFKLCKIFSKKTKTELLSGARPNFIVSCARRHTLTKHDVNSGYNAFGDKKTSSSSTENDYTAVKQHHHNRNFNNESINLSKPKSLMLSCSSKSELISAEENSSISTPSINSAE